MVVSREAGQPVPRDGTTCPVRRDSLSRETGQRSPNRTTPKLDRYKRLAKVRGKSSTPTLVHLLHAKTDDRRVGWGVGATTMNDSTTTLHIAVSQWFWRMATEAVRIRSNETYRDETLANVISEIALATPEPKCETTLLRRHFEVIPSVGSIKVELCLDSQAVANIVNVSRLITQQLGTAATHTDAISWLLYDYIASHHASKIMGAIEDELGKPH